MQIEGNFTLTVDPNWKQSQTRKVTLDCLTSIGVVNIDLPLIEDIFAENGECVEITINDFDGNSSVNPITVNTTTPNTLNNDATTSFVINIDGASHIVSVSSETDWITSGGSSSVLPTPTAPTYLEVNISSAQILNLGSAPVELLPPPSLNEYYEFKIDFEFSFLNTKYTLDRNLYIRDPLIYIPFQLITNFSDEIVSVSSTTTASSLNGQNTVATRDVNEGLSLFVLNQVNPTIGGGSLKVKIWYTIRTFG